MIDSRLGWINCRHDGRFVRGVGCELFRIDALTGVYCIVGVVVEGLSVVKADKEHIIRRRVSLVQTLLDRARNAGGGISGSQDRQVPRRRFRGKAFDSSRLYHLSVPT